LALELLLAVTQVAGKIAKDAVEVPMSRLNGLVFDTRVQASLITMCLAGVLGLWIWIWRGRGRGTSPARGDPYTYTYTYPYAYPYA